MYQPSSSSGRPGFTAYPPSSSYHQDSSTYPYPQGPPPPNGEAYHVPPPHSSHHYSSDPQQSTSQFGYNGGFRSQSDVSPPGSQYSGAPPSLPGSATIGAPSFAQQQQQRMTIPQGMLRILDYSPQDGDEGTEVAVTLDAEFPPSLDHNGQPSSQPANKTLRIVFGEVPVQTRVGSNAPRRTHDGGERYQQLRLWGCAPHPSYTGSLPNGAVYGRGVGEIVRVTTPVYVQVLNPEGGMIESKQVGHFSYEEGSRNGMTTKPHAQRPQLSYSPASNQSPRSSSLKRPGEHLVSDRASPSPSHAGSFYGKTVPGQSPGLPYDSNASSIYRSNRYAPGIPDGRESPASHIPEESRNGYSTYSAFPDPRNESSPSHPIPPQPHPIQNRSSSHGSPSNSSSSGMGMNGQPSLMRTSQLTAAAVPYQTASGSSAKASLDLQGDLNSMAVGWNQEEWQGRRRLVQFWRRQEGNVIHAAFRPIAQSEYIPNSIVISCVYRADKNECFVTSVDAIYLLEALVGVRFSVEEKNRIRRNLEGFRPITVSKSKPGCEDFFKLIMSFPNPKPRNIEKDVKVFPWSVFGTALKKIIGKYSASYIHAPNGNMGPPLAHIERPPSPPIAPYVIPAPLMNPDGSLSAVPDPPNSYQGDSSPYASRPGPLPYGNDNSSGHSNHSGSGGGGHMQSDGSYTFQPKFESNELFAPGGPNAHMPPTPTTSSSYNGISSSSSNSLPTLSHPGLSGGGMQNGSSSGSGSGLPMSRHSSQGPMSADSSGGYTFAAHQAVGMSPSISSGSHASHGAAGGYLPLPRQMTASPMHATMDVGAGYR